ASPTPAPPMPAPDPTQPLKPDRLLPEIPAYGSLPALSDILMRGNLMSLGQRLDATPSVDRDLWIKVDGFHLQQSARNGFSFEGHGTSLTVGGDRSGTLNDGKNWRGGVFAVWNRAWLDVSGEGKVIPSRATSDIHLDSLQAGVYGQLDQNGWFARGIVLGGRERAKVSTEDRYFNTLHATVWALHLAAGKVFEPAPGWRLVPQANASYANFDWNLVDDSIKGRYDKTRHWYGGAGLRVEKTVNDTLKLWLRPGVTHQFGDVPALALRAPDVYLPAAGPSTTWQVQAGFNRDTRWGGYYGLVGGSWGRGQQMGRVEAGWRRLW
ncbi:autotransporter domain-containing protein, partial [Craterilacuibacter sp.]|uniref:autotransporter domain-containing protein n=1 Tax=Craterilacuibacter sp. TaxID=2870909 RepID=UPI003F33964D